MIGKITEAFIDEMETKLDIQAMNKNANGDEEESESKGTSPTEEQVIKFLKAHPSPKDEDYHEWAEENGFNVHKAEAVAYKIISDLVGKGRSKGEHPAGVAKADVTKGVKIEAEHTPNKTIQHKITDDHNTELKKYYDPKEGLPKMEKNLEKKAEKGDTVNKSARDASYAIMAGFVRELDKISMSTEDVKKKISAPPTGDTGPSGKGLNDPRAIAAQKAIMEKKGEEKRSKDLLAILKKEPMKKAAKCDTPGKKIRSGGRGKGLAIGKGKGPIGIPKEAATAIPRDEPAMRGEGAKYLSAFRKSTKLGDPKDAAKHLRSNLRTALTKKAADAKARAEELNDYINQAGGNVVAGVKAYNKKNPKNTKV